MSPRSWKTSVTWNFFSALLLLNTVNNVLAGLNPKSMAELVGVTNEQCPSGWGCKLNMQHWKFTTCVKCNVKKKPFVMKGCPKCLYSAGPVRGDPSALCERCQVDDSITKNFKDYKFVKESCEHQMNPQLLATCSACDTPLTAYRVRVCNQCKIMMRYGWEEPDRCVQCQKLAGLNPARPIPNLASSNFPKTPVTQVASRTSTSKSYQLPTPVLPNQAVQISSRRGKEVKREKSLNPN